MHEKKCNSFKFAGNVYTINIKLSEATNGGVEKPQRKNSVTEPEGIQEPCPKIPATEKSCTENPCTDISATVRRSPKPVNTDETLAENAANNTIINNTSNNQYNKTTTNRDKETFSSAEEIVNWAMRQAKDARQHFSVVVDEDVRALMDLGEQQSIDRKSILFFVGRYGKEAVKTQLGNLEFAEKRGSIDNPGGWLNCALQNGYSNLAAEKAMTKHDEALRKQEAIKRILEEEATDN